MPVMSPDDIARIERLETTMAYLSGAWGRMEEIREFLGQTCQHGTVIKGADAAELFLAVEDAMRELDQGWLLIRQERARGTKVQVNPMFVPMFK